MATINPSQSYDVIHTLTFDSTGGNMSIRLYRGGGSAFSGTVYYRAGTSGAWTTLSVSGTTTTFPVTNTTMQVAHDWNKSGDHYMTPSWYQTAKQPTTISISQKAVLSGVIGNYFMYNYAYGCSSLTSLSVPDTSSVTSVGGYFMYNYASGCTSLTQLRLPNTTGYFSTENINWSVPSGRLGILKAYVKTPSAKTAWEALTVSGKTLYTNYIRSTSDVIVLAPIFNPALARRILLVS